jgi:hypothetical protein
MPPRTSGKGSLPISTKHESIFARRSEDNPLLFSLGAGFASSGGTVGWQATRKIANNGIDILYMQNLLYNQWNRNLILNQLYRAVNPQAQFS